MHCVTYFDGNVSLARIHASALPTSTSLRLEARLRTMMNSRKFHDFDFYMVITAGLLIGFGVVAIWSAQGGEQLSILNDGVRQAVFAIMGVMLLILVASFNYRFLRTLAWLFYAVSLATLVIVLIPGMGVYIAGSRRWFDLGITTVQPSEFAKLVTIIALSSFVASRGEQMARARKFRRFAAHRVGTCRLRLPRTGSWHRQCFRDYLVLDHSHHAGEMALYIAALCCRRSLCLVCLEFRPAGLPESALAHLVRSLQGSNRRWLQHHSGQVCHRRRRCVWIWAARWNAKPAGTTKGP